MKIGIRRLLSQRLTCLAFFLCLCCQYCEAHPTSHIDAWVRVGDQINVRLTLFLDDMLATQSGLAVPMQTRMPATAIRAAQADFEERLPELFSVFDAHGQILAVARIKSPRWRVPSGGMEIEANAGLRLTWELIFDRPADVTSLSVRHRLTQHSLDSTADATNPAPPAELRLRVRSDSSGRRIAATISHHLPHTIVLPEATSESRFRQNEVPATATFVLLPGRLIHELSIPLSLAPFLASNRNAHSSNPLIDAGSPERISVRETIRHAKRWAGNSLFLQTNDTVSIPESCSIELLTARNEPLPPSTTFSSVGTRLGIRSVHVIDNAPARVSVKWSNMAPELSQVVVHSHTASTSGSRLVNQSDSDGTMCYDWVVPSRSLTANDRPTIPSAAGVNLSQSHSFWNRRQPAPWVWPIVCMSLLAGLGIAGFGSTRRRHVRQFGLTLSVGSCCVMAATAHWSDVHPDSNSAATVLNSLLNQVYRATLTEHDDLRVQQLSLVLTDELVETLHEHLAAANAESDNSPLVEIDDVQLTKCNTQSFVAETSAHFDCEWQVSGQILHWGHRHQRQLALAGVIQLKTTDDRFRISHISVENVHENDTPNTQPNLSGTRILTGNLSSLSEVGKTCNRHGDN